LSDKPPSRSVARVSATPAVAAPKYTLQVPCAYIVSYDLKAEGDGFNYLPFMLELQGSLDWWHFLERTWIVVRRDLLVDFTNILLGKLHSKDRLLVLPAKGPAMGWLPTDAWDWMNANLTKEWK
jgi:hypothetical protein